MLPVERRSRILSALRGAGVLATDDLADRFGVSGETIRRDIAALERTGHAVRVHGGAMSASASARVNDEPPFEIRRAEQREAKKRIGEIAAGLVSPGDVVGIDVGTTSLHVAQNLAADFRGTVVTPNVLVAAELAGRPGVDVLLAGGHIRGGDLTAFGAETVEFLGTIHYDIAFLSSGGISISTGLTDFYREEAAARRQFVLNSAKTYVVGDSTKIEKVAPYAVCSLDAVTGLITERAPDEAFIKGLSRFGLALHTDSKASTQEGRTVDDLAIRSPDTRSSSSPLPPWRNRPIGGP